MSAERTVSYIQPTPLTCDQCGAAFTADVWLILDVVERPDLADRARTGELHRVACPNGHPTELSAPLLLSLQGQTPPLLFFPARQSKGDRDREHGLALLDRVRRRFGPSWREEWVAGGLDVVPPALLGLAIREGVQVVLKVLAEEASREAVLNALQRLVSAETPEERGRVIRTHPGLLGGRADGLLAEMIHRARAKADEHAADVFEERRNLIRRCRDVGVEAAVAAESGVADEGARLPDRVALGVEVEAAVAAEKRYRGSNDPAALNEWVTAWENVLHRPDFASEPVAFRLSVLNEVAQALFRRYEAQGDDLGRAVSLWREVVELTPADSPERPGRLTNLGAALMLLAKRGDNKDEFDGAVACFEQAAALAAPGSADLAGCLNNLGNGLSERYARYGDPADLDRAVGALERSVGLTPESSPEGRETKGARWNNLGNALSELYARKGQRSYLDRAIAEYEWALELTPGASPGRAATLNNLAGGYRDQFRLTGDLNDLNRAVQAFAEAADQTDPHSPSRAGRLTNLGSALSERYAVTELAKDLDEAVDAYEKASSLVPKGSSAEATVLANLSPALVRRATRNQDASDLERAVEMSRRSLSLTPEGSPETAARLNNLGGALRQRYTVAGGEPSAPSPPTPLPRVQGRGEKVGSPPATVYEGYPSDLDEAITVHRLAVGRVGEFSPDRPGMLANLGAVLYIRFKRTTRPTDRDEAIKAWHTARQGLHATMIAPTEAGRVSAQAAAITRNLLQAHLDRGALAAALEDLEAGKALGLRLALLRANHVPAGLNEEEEKEWRGLIEELRAIDSDRRAPGGAQLSDAVRASRFADLSHRQRKALTRVQALEARDATSSVAPFRYSDLRGLAAGHDLTLAYLQPLDGATVAILVHAASPPDSPASQDVLTLNGLTRAELRRLLLQLPEGLASAASDEDRLRSLLTAVRGGQPLGWLRAYWLAQHPDLATSDRQDAERWWRDTMERILKELSHHLSEPLARRLRDLKARRVVFVPGDHLALLPLHAVPVPWDGAPHAVFGDEFIISFTPSAVALSYSLSRTGPWEQQEPTLVAIANPDGSLVFADEEVDRIASQFVPGKQRVAHGTGATRDWLRAHAVEGDFLELAAHGSFVPGRPARSALLLAHPQRPPAPPTARQEQDDRLTLDDLWSGRLPLKNGCVVTMAACETGQVDLGAEVEESLGFPAAFLGQGASSVIGSLWAVNDLSTALLMDKVYELLLQPGYSPAKAVQQAGHWLRKLPREDVRRCLETRRAAVAEALAAFDVHQGGPLAERLAAERNLEDRLELLKAALERLDGQPDPPFAHPVFWAAFTAYGA